MTKRGEPKVEGQVSREDRKGCKFRRDGPIDGGKPKGEPVFAAAQREEGGDAAQKSHQILGCVVGSSCLFCRFLTPSSKQRKYRSEDEARHEGKEDQDQLILTMNKRRAERQPDER